MFFLSYIYTLDFGPLPNYFLGINSSEENCQVQGNMDLGILTTLCPGKVLLQVHVPTKGACQLEVKREEGLETHPRNLENVLS